MYKQKSGIEIVGCIRSLIPALPFASWPILVRMHGQERSEGGFHLFLIHSLVRRNTSR